jgi:hypothetical protein
LPRAVTADWRLRQPQGHHRSRAGFKECTGRFLVPSPCGELSSPLPVTFPNLRSGSQPVEHTKGLPSLLRSLPVTMAPLQASARRENALLLLGCFNPSLVSFDGTSHLHRSSSVTSPSRDSSSPRRSEGHRHFRLRRLRSPASAPYLQPQPTQWKRQFLNFFGCPGSAAPPLPGLSRRVASRRLRKLTAPSARASQSP